MEQLGSRHLGICLPEKRDGVDLEGMCKHTCMNVYIYIYIYIYVPDTFGVYLARLVYMQYQKPS